MNPVRALRRQTGLTQAELAAEAGTSQPTIAAYEAGRRSPTLRTMDRLAAAAGVEMAVTFHPAMTREERRSLRLHEAIAAHLLEDRDRVLGLARETLGRMRERHPGAAPLLREWEVLLERPLSELVPALTDPSLRGRELRHVTPFAGVLSAPERARVYRSFAEEEARR